MAIWASVYKTPELDSVLKVGCAASGVCSNAVTIRKHENKAFLFLIIGLPLPPLEVY